MTRAPRNRTILLLALASLLTGCAGAGLRDPGHLYGRWGECPAWARPYVMDFPDRG